MSELKRPLFIASLGAGIQSSAMVLASFHGLIPLFDAAIFADTQSEWSSTYSWLRKLTIVISPKIPVHRVSNGNLGKHIYDRLQGHRMDNPPFWTRGAGETSGGQPLIRKCTREFKITPIKRKMRELLDAKGKRLRGIHVKNARGISVDEVHRCRASDERWIEAVYPLIDLGWNRNDCEKYLIDVMGLIPQKSACWFCPYTSDSQWVNRKRKEPIQFDQAVHMDAEIRHFVPGCEGEAFLHRSRKPLGDAVRETEQQGDLFDDNSFARDECGGDCGV